MKINENFSRLEKNYLFIEIAKRVKAYETAHPDVSLIRMGIGDVTRPIVPAVIEAMKKGVDEMGDPKTFKGYEDSGTGYDFLKQAVASYYQSFGVTVALDEIRINDGAKSDTGNIVDVFGKGTVALITDPAYPVYVDTNIMAGNTVIYADSTEENGFAAMPDPNVRADVIYLCSPNNPTGSVYTKEQLKIWVDYANANDAVIIFDAAYEAFVSDPSLPRSIFEIEGARTCAVEMCSLSKTAGFTGMRCGYTVIPNELTAKTENGDTVRLSEIWNRRQGSKFNGVSYPVQCAAAAVFTEEGLKQIRENIAYYQNNAKIIGDTLDALGIFYTGGKHSPYIWMKCPRGMDSWTFFDFLLDQAHVVGTPGAGFGKNGTHFFRLTAFNTPENTKRAMENLKNALK